MTSTSVSSLSVNSSHDKSWMCMSIGRIAYIVLSCKAAGYVQMVKVCWTAASIAVKFDLFFAFLDKFLKASDACMLNLQK